MKSILVIGLGKFGHHLVNKLLEMGKEVMIVDKNEKGAKTLLHYALNTKEVSIIFEEND